MMGLQRITIHFIDDPNQEINEDCICWLLEDDDALSHFVVLFRRCKDCWGTACINQYDKSKFDYRAEY